MMRMPRHDKRFSHRAMLLKAAILLILSFSTVTASSYSTNEVSSYSKEEQASASLPFLEGTWETCGSHATCDACYSASHTCHWCASDNGGGACHVATSPHGCMVGASCSPQPHEDSQTCFDHKNCGDCAESSWECHWCSSDESCHAKGSRHGCAAGENCYAINRCQRLEPERIEDGGTFSKSSFHGVGPVAKGILWVMMGLVLCCSTMCFGGASFVKCAVDDLVGEPVEVVEDGMHSGGGQQYETLPSEEVGGRDELEIPLMQNEETTEEQAEEGNGNLGDDTDNKPTNDSMLMRSEAASVAAQSRISRSSTRAVPRGSSIKQMYCACQMCYLFTVLTTILLFITGMSYAPRAPQYNVCTNEIAWKSIVEGMASLKMSASFDLLISVYNPNRFEVDLSNGHGQFHHDGEYVGSFDIPEGKVSEKAISDIVVKVTFTPDKWSALSLTSEYYQKKLKFVIGGHAHVKVPALGNYSFDAKFDDIHVNVNDPSMDDTHLCACPGWKKP